MVVTFFTSRFPVSSETFILNQIISFINMGHDVRILSIWPGDMTHRHESFDTYNLKAKTSFLLNEEGSGLKKLFKRVGRTAININYPNVRQALNVKKYGTHGKKLLLSSILANNNIQVKSDYFIVHFGVNGVIATQLRELGLLVGKIGTIFHGVDMSHKETLEIYANDYRKLFNSCELILPISNLWKDKLITLGCPAEKIHVARMGIDISRFKFNPKIIRSSNLSFISIARLSEKKGMHIAIEAFALLRKKGFEFNYKIIGGGPLKNELQRLIDKHELGDNIQLLGFKSQEEIKKYLSDSDVFLLPSLTAKNGDMEGIPVALMEAMAVGIPVISTLHSGIPELIDDNISGWLAKENDIISLFEVIKKVITTKKNIIEILMNARSKIENSFNQDKLYRDLSKLLELDLRE